MWAFYLIILSSDIRNEVCFDNQEVNSTSEIKIDFPVIRDSNIIHDTTLTAK